jgi:hypothetical protein
MQTVTTIGLDIAKSVFQVHGVDAAGQVVIRRRLKRWFGTVALATGIIIGRTGGRKAEALAIA